MKKYTIHAWHIAQPVIPKMKEAGYEFYQELTEEQLLPAAMAIFNTGLNVMLFHIPDGGVLWVDNYKFGQR